MALHDAHMVQAPTTSGIEDNFSTDGKHLAIKHDERLWPCNAVAKLWLRIGLPD